jgi:hypothetical protein
MEEDHYRFLNCPISSSRMWGLKNVSTNDHSKPPLEEKVFAVIPLVPLLTISL